MIMPLASMTMQQDSGIDTQTASQTGSFTTGQGYSMATNAGDGATVAFTGAMQTSSSKYQYYQ